MALGQSVQPRPTAVRITRPRRLLVGLLAIGLAIASQLRFASRPPDLVAGLLAFAAAIALLAYALPATGPDFWSLKRLAAWQPSRRALFASGATVTLLAASLWQFDTGTNPNTAWILWLAAMVGAIVTAVWLEGEGERAAGKSEPRTERSAVTGPGEGRRAKGEGDTLPLAAQPPPAPGALTPTLSPAGERELGTSGSASIDDPAAPDVPHPTPSRSGDRSYGGRSSVVGGRFGDRSEGDETPEPDNPLNPLTKSADSSSRGDQPVAPTSIQPSAFSLQPSTLIVAALTLVGLGLRFLRLETLPEGVWFDEAIFGIAVDRLLAEPNYRPVFFVEFPNPAMFFYPFALATQIFGPGPFALRAATAVAGALSIPMIYLVTRRLFGSPRIALVAAAFLTFSSWHLTMSRFPTSPAIFTATLDLVAMFFLVRAVQERSARDFLLAGLAFGLDQNFYSPARLTTGAIAVFFALSLLRLPDFRRHLLTGGLLFSFGIGVAAGPLVHFAVRHPEDFNRRVSQVSILPEIERAGNLNPLRENIIKHLLMFNVQGDPNGRHGIPGEPMLDQIMAALFVLGLGLVVVQITRPSSPLLVAWWGFTLLPGVLSLAFEAPQSLRAMGSMNPTFILAALPLGALWDRWIRAPWGTYGVGGRGRGQRSATNDQPAPPQETLTPTLSLAREREHAAPIQPSAFSLQPSQEALTPTLSLARERESGASGSASIDDPAVPDGPHLTPSRSGDRSYGDEMLEHDNPFNPLTKSADGLSPGDQPVAPTKRSTFNTQHSTAIQPSAFSLQPSLTELFAGNLRSAGPRWHGPSATDRATRWAVPGGIIAAVLLVGVLNYQRYFVTWANNPEAWAVHSTAETIVARRAKELSRDTQIFVSQFFADGPPTMRWLAPNLPPLVRYDRAAHIPVQGSAPRTVFFLDSQEGQAVAQLRRLYPNATFDPVALNQNSGALLTQVTLTREDVVALQGVEARYYRGTETKPRPDLALRERQIEVDPAALNLGLPVLGEWTSTLQLPEFGIVQFELDGPAGVELFVDGSRLLNGPGAARQVLAQGGHALRIRALTTDPGQPVRLRWRLPSGTAGPVPADRFYLPPVTANGLLARFYRNESFGGDPAIMRIDPQVNFYFHILPLPRPYSAEWTGKLLAPANGTYRFAIDAVSTARLTIDGRVVLDSGAPGGFPEADVQLTAGAHDISVRFVDRDAFSHVYLYWNRPGAGREAIPSEFLLPPQGEDLPPPVAAPTGPSAPPAVIPVGNVRFGPEQVLPLAVSQVFGTSGEGRLREPRDAAVDADGNLFVLDAGNRRVVVFRPDGSVQRTFADGWEDPTGLVVDQNGFSFVVDAGPGWVTRYDQGGRPAGRFGGPDAGLYRPRGLAIGDDGTVYVADTGRNRIVRFSPNGGQLGIVGGAQGAGPGQYLEPTDAVLMPGGELLILDTGNRRVQWVDATGRPRAEWPINWSVPLNGPHVALDGQGRPVVTDPDRGRIVRYDPANGLVIVAGTKGSAPGQLSLPVGITAGPDGTIYVIDTGNNQVLRVEIGG